MAAFRMLVQILAEMGEGKDVTMVPLQREMTTQKAADFLEISRPSLLKLLEKGEMRFRMVGNHRRILFADVVEYRKRSMAHRHAALDELAKQAQKLGLGY
jgi:excisionase family DNA binding protein